MFLFLLFEDPLFLKKKLFWDGGGVHVCSVYCLLAKESCFFLRSMLTFAFLSGLNSIPDDPVLGIRLLKCIFTMHSRGDTQDFADLDKLAKRFLRGGRGSAEAKVVPSRAYIQEVVEELRRGEQGECPICLEAFEDAVLTPCAHRLCRECLLASWRNAASGLCPVCRYMWFHISADFPVCALFFVF